MMFRIIRRRSAYIALAACVAVAAGAVGISEMRFRRAAATAAAVTNWGLSFREEGKAPVGNATAADLAAHNAFFVADTTEPVIYLTFDAGYENGHTAAILDALKKHNAPATFFVVGHYLDTAPELVKRMVAEGHTVGNHTDHHPDMSKIADRGSFRAELNGVEDRYRAITGQELPRLYRPPQGKFSTANLRMAAEEGYATFFWSLAYVDWLTDSQPTAEQAFSKLLPRIHPGAIVLLHSTSATNAAILDDLLTKWETMGYRFGKLTDLTAPTA